MTSEEFCFSGFAARTDLRNSEWQALFEFLAAAQDDLSRRESLFRSEAYKWPRDPLRTWSRVWEYPYVYRNIEKLVRSRGADRIKVLDYGSGVTFFPFAVANLGCDVTCADIDPVCATDIPRADACVSKAAQAGEVMVAIIEDDRVPIEARSQDVVYCISVLEHIPNFEHSIREMSRVLKPGGSLILTIDVDLRGNFELGIDEFARLQHVLDVHFYRSAPERAIHPADLLTTVNSPFHIKSSAWWPRLKRVLKSASRGEWLSGGPSVDIYLCVYACTLVKR